MISRQLSLTFFLLLAPLAIYADSATTQQKDDQIIPQLEEEISRLSTQQDTLKIQKSTIQNELSKTQNQLLDARSQQKALSQNIDVLNVTTHKLATENELLTRKLAQKQQECEELSKKIQHLENEYSRLEDDLNSTQEELEIAHYREKELAHECSQQKDIEHALRTLNSEHKKLEDNLNTLQEELHAAYANQKELSRTKLRAETEALQEIHRLERELISLQELADDSSWSEVTRKH